MSEVIEIVEDLNEEDTCCPIMFNMWAAQVFHLDEDGWFCQVTSDSKVEEELIGFLISRVDISYCPFCGTILIGEK